MILTYNQKKVLRQSGMCKITYRNMYKEQHSLAYCSKGGYFYDITVAKDVLPVEIQMIALIHECGHIALSHVHNDIKADLKQIEDLCKELNKPASMLRIYGGPMGFINVCMDLEVNDKYLTKANVELMEQCDFPPCTVESYDVPVLGDYHNYFRPLIEKLPETDKEFEQMKKQIEEQLKKQAQQKKQNKQNGQNKQNQNGKGQKGQSQPGNGQGQPGQFDPNGTPQLGQGQGIPMPLPEWAQDMVDKATQEAMEGLSQDLKDALNDENYTSGSDRAKYNESQDAQGKSSGVQETTVEEATDEAEAEGDQGKSGQAGSGKKSGQSYGIGTAHVSKGPEFGDIIEQNDESIKKFLSRFLDHKPQYRHDPLRHYNRGTRENPHGLLYSSMRRKVQQEKTKIAILVDVSGSMDTNMLLKGISAIKAAENVIDPASILVTWDTSKCQEFKIREIPEKVRSGGGTDMEAGVRYLVNKGFKKVVLYSDMETGVADIIDLMKDKKVEMYTICTDSYDEDRLSEEMKNYFRLNKAFIRMGKG